MYVLVSGWCLTWCSASMHVLVSSLCLALCSANMYVLVSNWCLAPCSTSSSGEDDSGNILVTVPWHLSHGLLLLSSYATATIPGHHHHPPCIHTTLLFLQGVCSSLTRSAPNLRHLSGRSHGLSLQKKNLLYH